MFGMDFILGYLLGIAIVLLLGENARREFWNSLRGIHTPTQEEKCGNCAKRISEGLKNMARCNNGSLTPTEDIEGFGYIAGKSDKISTNKMSPWLASYLKDHPKAEYAEIIKAFQEEFFQHNKKTGE